MRAHAAFVPTLVLERLAADPRAPAEPYETSFPAAVMFVDIARSNLATLASRGG